mmetsp:Transcript_7326/g.11195  ORF Transcript_7326/g.11195 Transcript_7326/m.11195 type:complete len:229 (+) Transcript_7326:1050-1736(+)
MRQQQLVANGFQLAEGFLRKRIVVPYFGRELIQGASVVGLQDTYKILSAGCRLVLSILVPQKHNTQEVHVDLHLRQGFGLLVLLDVFAFPHRSLLQRSGSSSSLLLLLLFVLLGLLFRCLDLFFCRFLAFPGCDFLFQTFCFFFGLLFGSGLLGLFFLRLNLGLGGYLLSFLLVYSCLELRQVFGLQTFAVLLHGQGEDSRGQLLAHRVDVAHDSEEQQVVFGLDSLG